jgi:hypothetical protein
MDYNLQKWIEPSFLVPRNNISKGITPFPSQDFINPGVTFKPS